jgi:TnpA family transposase
MNLSEDLVLLDKEELALVKSKYTEQNQLLFAIMLKFFQAESCYPTQDDIFPEILISSLAEQLGITASKEDGFNWHSRSIRRFRQDIRAFLGYKSPTNAHKEQLIKHLMQHSAPKCLKIEQSKEIAYKFFKDLKIEPFQLDKLEQYIAISERRFEHKLFVGIYSALSKETKDSFDKILSLEDCESDIPDAAEQKNGNDIPLWRLKKDIAGAKLKLVQAELDKIAYLGSVELPRSLLATIDRKLLLKYYNRIMSAYPSDIKKYAHENKHVMMAVFFYIRLQLVTDGTVETFLQLIHKMRTSAEKFIKKEIISGVTCVGGKFDILYSLARASLDHPKGVIKRRIYSKVSKVILRNVIKDHRSARGKWYQEVVQTKIHSLYLHGHRRVLRVLLNAFEFTGEEEQIQHLVSAINFIKSAPSSEKYYPDNSEVPMEAITENWRSFVIEKCPMTSEERINCMNYEVAILEQLKKPLSCKRLWVKGSYSFRDPKEDFPKDFDDRKEYYYQLLNLPLCPKEFIKELKDELRLEMQGLNDSILENALVKITGDNKKKARIRITPYIPQELPINLHILQRAINKRFSTINLIDILKETSFRTNFTDQFQSITNKDSIDKDKLLKRLLLCLYGIGSNTGLKRVSGANAESSYSNLRYVKRRYINADNVRAAIVEVVNAIINIRDPKIWGVATTACSCDSKKIFCWDQNLMSEWHTRYRGRGVMVYWHVDQNSACIYSQLKTCSSSEVGSMIHGFLRHDSKMNMNKTYMDTHGQSVIGFAVGELLHLGLLPRIKNINKQKLYYADQADKDLYPNLSLVLKGSIDWELIETHYKEIVKYIAALKIGTIEANSFIKHFSANNYNHPIYKALTELGNAAKTIFLCKYVSSEELRIEVNEALNIVERVNGLMGFIFYGKLGEISTNYTDEQELSIVCLHLLQVCMVYINTLLIQEMLSDPEWKIQLTKEDKRALSPLIHSHINPYGLFPLDLNERLIITKFPVHQNQRSSL